MEQKELKNLDKMTKEQLIKIIEAQNQKASARAEAQKLQPAQPAPEMMVPQPTPVIIQAPVDEVGVVYCSNSLGFIKISTMELRFHKYGEEIRVNRNQFDELVGKYYKWFEQGILAVADRNLDVALAKGLHTISENSLTRADLEGLETATPEEVTSLWEKCPSTVQKATIASYIKEKFNEGAQGFRRVELIDTMNRLTDNSFIFERDELMGRVHIDPTDFSR